MKYSGFRDYSDKHFNIFWPYGGAQYWENNLTAALARYLFYSNSKTRKSFVQNCLQGSAKSLGGDYEVWLQRKQIPDSLSQHAYRKVMLIRPGDLNLLVDELKHPDLSQNHTTPDLWLVNPKNGSMIIVEIKLWPGANKTAKNQIKAYAKKFNAGILPEVSLDSVYQWVNHADHERSEVQRFLQENLLSYLEDLGCSDYPVFRARHVATEMGTFKEKEMFLLRVEALLKELAPRIEEYGQFKPSARFSYDENQEACDLYANGTFNDSDLIGTFDFGFHADWDPPAVRGMSFLLTDSSKVKKLIKDLASETVNRRKYYWRDALATVPDGFQITFKRTLYEKRTARLQEWPYKYRKTGNKWREISSQNNGNGDNTRFTVDEILPILHQKLSRSHQKKTHKILNGLKVNGKWHATLVFSFPGMQIPFEELASEPREKILRRMEVQVSELWKFHTMLVGKY